MVEAEAALARCRIAGLADRRTLCALGRTFVSARSPPRTPLDDGRAGSPSGDGDERPRGQPDRVPPPHVRLLRARARAPPRACPAPHAGSRADRRRHGRDHRARRTTPPTGAGARDRRGRSRSGRTGCGARSGSPPARRPRTSSTRPNPCSPAIATVHEGGPVGVAIVPAYREDPLTRHLGTDTYANVATYAGLTAMALSWLARTTPPARPPRTSWPPAATRRTAATAPSRRRAPTERGSRCAHTATDSGDPRYDFGLVAAKHRTAAGWIDLVPNRPGPARRPRPPVRCSRSAASPAIPTASRCGSPRGAP